MKKRHKVGALAAAMFAITGALAATVPQTAAAAGIDTCDLGAKVRELSGWDTNGQYNIMVWKESARWDSHFHGIVGQGHEVGRECKGWNGTDVHIFWMVFRDGDFTRQGDGGVRNWAFQGRVQRNDYNLKFLAR